MTFDQAMAFWLDRVDFERKPATPGDLKLEHMQALLRLLGDPHLTLRIAHVAGSKGKGSTSALLESVTRAAGHRTGLFTSPHLTDVAERIRINGESIGREQLASALAEVKPAVDELKRLGIELTFFELATALGFLHFARENVDLAVVEVGLGGRFDATNVCHPAVSLVTSISHDHTAILGDQLADIAFEKCGIIKPGVPVVSGVTRPEAVAVVRRTSAERGCRLIELGDGARYNYRPGRVSGIGAITPARVVIEVGDEILDEYTLGLLGEHQAANATLAVTAARLLTSSGLTIGNDAIRRGLSAVRWPARLEVFPGPPLTVLDCAHNVASADALVETLETSFPKGNRVLLFASSGDKDVGGILRVLLPHVDAAVVTRFLSNPRAVPPARLRELAAETNPEVMTSVDEDPHRALERLLFAEPPADLVVVAGSVFLAGELRPMLVNFGKA